MYSYPSLKPVRQISKNEAQAKVGENDQNISRAAAEEHSGEHSFFPPSSLWFSIFLKGAHITFMRKNRTLKIQNNISFSSSITYKEQAQLRWH